MLKSEADKIKSGVYRIFWKREKGGGSSVASVGRTASNYPWLAPSNWISPPSTKGYREWHKVERVELIALK